MVALTFYVPATFDLYEFDDGSVATGQSTPPKRWFVHWDGLIGAPAEEVILGWSAGDAVAMVCTSGGDYDRAGARFRAAHLALGGDALPIPGRPQGILATNQAMEELTTSGLWTGSGDVPDHEVTAETAAADGFAIGHQRVGGCSVFIAAVNVEPARFAVRTVRDWSAYDVDARTSFPRGALKG
ncbi:hypothetical protein [Streptomyces sp. NPDC020917]|uniref:hypothetical protein n=1 Tax=Streptomyces sp. NPDC020917 TaxID=3365102 RepID=UPI00378E9F5E